MTDSSGTTTYTYDSLNRLVSETSPTGSWVYEYDALGNLVATIYDGQTTDNLVDPTGLGNAVAQYIGSGSLIASYTYGLGLVSQVTSSGTNYYDFDALGSTAGLTNATSGLVASYSYLPFGGLLASTGSVANPFSFVGQAGVMSGDDALFEMRDRFYDADSGEFLTNDPLGLSAGDANLRRYARGEPISNSDPSGLDYAYIVSAPISIPVVGRLLQKTIFHHTAVVWSASNSYQAGQTIPGKSVTASVGFVPSHGSPVDAGRFQPLTGPQLKHLVALSGPMDDGAGVVSRIVQSVEGGSSWGWYFLEPCNCQTFTGEVQRAYLDYWNPPDPDPDDDEDNSTPTTSYSDVNNSNPTGGNPTNSGGYGYRTGAGYGYTSGTPGYSSGISGYGPTTSGYGGTSSGAGLRGTTSGGGSSGFPSGGFNNGGNGSVAAGTSSAGSSIDPNAMVGPKGYGPGIFVSGSALSLFPYKIEFENAPTATAPAQRVVIEDSLNSDLDLNTFQLTDIAFGDSVLTIPAGSQDYQTTVPMTDNGETIDVVVNAGLDYATRQLTVTFQSIDPQTGSRRAIRSGSCPPRTERARARDT